MTVLLLLLATLVQAVTPVPALEGVVMRGATTEPVAHARVLITPSGAANVRATLTSTDEHGRFIVPNLPSGAYRIIADHDGFLRATTPVTVLDSKTTSVGIAMTPTGVISGRIADARGNPVARAFVRATTGQQTYEAQTNDLGEYRIFDLPPGGYVVSAAPYNPPRIEGTTLIRPGPPSPYSPGEGQAMLGLTRMVQAGDYIDPIALTREIYLPAFYPGTTDKAAAATLELTAGATVSIDLTVVRAPAAR